MVAPGRHAYPRSRRLRLSLRRQPDLGHRWRHSYRRHPRQLTQPGLRASSELRVTGIRFRLACLLPAILSVALLGCGAQPPPNAEGASRFDTSALPVTARTFLSTLNASQRANATFRFDDPERTGWAYVPQRRSGIPLKEMDAEQRAVAFGLLGTGLSGRGTGLARG